MTGIYQFARRCKSCIAIAAIFVLAIAATGPVSKAQEKAQPPLKLLFLGDQGHHQPANRAAQLIPVMEPLGIEIEYTEKMADLNSDRLSSFDGLIIYANIDNIAPDQEKALLDYVNSGKGLIPLHCATYCFRNSKAYIDLVGAQFLRHGGEVFSTVVAEPNHPIMKGFGGLQSWDETYVHHMHNDKDRTILEYRRQGMQADGQSQEPWTWVRTHGEGRVFYTAWGHDARTWGNAGFQNLVRRGVLWACKRDPSIVPPYQDPSIDSRSAFVPPKMAKYDGEMQPFEYADVGSKIPNYTPSNRWGVQGKPLNMMQLPLPPQESLKHYQVPEGFELQLFASEPDLKGKPIAMSWDDRGRLWVCETIDYPNEMQEPGKGNDRIRICEDTDGDGKADKFTVFAENLSIPSTLTHYLGGVIVQDGPTTIFLKDTDGDDVADAQQVLITGWNMGDTHGGVGNMRYGLDNWMWAMQGYNNSAPVFDGKKQTAFRMGFWRFKVTEDSDSQKTAEGYLPGLKAQRMVAVEAVEFIRSTDNNTWGIGISEEGLIFGSTANRDPSVFMPIPNRYYERVRGWAPEQLHMISDTYLFKPVTDKIRQVDQHGGYTAAAGHALYTARTYPEQWWNRTAFVCGPTGHLVGTFVLSRDGAGYKSTSPMNLVASDDEWAAPIMAEVGPDGNVWICDWYNYIIQHNPTPEGFKTGKGQAYETDLRDKKHGRIYRLAYTGGTDENTQSPKLDISNPQSCVAALAHPTMMWRSAAQRLLVERGNKDIIPQLIDLVADQSVDAIGLNAGAIHALWTLDGIGAIKDKSPEVIDAVTKATKHPSAGVRRNAIAVLAANATPSTVDLANLSTDTDPQVQLAALLAMADGETNEAAGKTLAGLATQSDLLADQWLSDGLTAAAATHSVPFLTNVLAAESNDKQVAVAAVVRIVAEHAARGRLSIEDTESILSAIPVSSSPVTLSLLEGLSSGWASDHRIALSDRGLQTLGKLFESLPADMQGPVLQLAAKLDSQSIERYAGKIISSLQTILDSEEASADQKLAAATQWISLQVDSPDVVTELLDLIDPRTEPALATGLVASLGKSRADNVPQELLSRLPSLTPAVKEAAIQVLLGRPESTKAYLQACADGKARISELKLEQRQALQEHPTPAIRRQARELLASGGVSLDANRQRVVESKMPLCDQRGSVDAGKIVFTKNCASCHRHGGEGQAIGPDLTGMAVHPKSELLVHILDPSRSVEGNFRTYSVLTADGVVFNGMLATETKTTVELIDTKGKRETLLREDIERINASDKSLMPEGFESQISDQELTDLLEFLTNKGKYVPLAIDKVATAISTKGLFHEGDNGPDRIVFRNWQPKTFREIPFVLVDPQDKRTPNIILLNGPLGTLPPKMPKSVSLPCNTPAKAIHLLSGISGWGYPASDEKSVTMIVRLNYEDGEVEDHPLLNGVHFSDYIRRVDVPKSEFAFDVRGQQLRYLSVEPKTAKPIKSIDLVKGSDETAPIVVAVTLETR